MTFFQNFSMFIEVIDWNFFLFSLFSLFTVFSARMVIAVTNPIYSILFLILVFTGSVGILLLLGAEFLAMILLIVYVGAIAVLFLFVVMMLNIRVIELKDSFFRYFPFGSFISIILILEIFLLISDFDKTIPFKYSLVSNLNSWDNDGIINWINYINGSTNMEVLGQLIYTYYFYLFLVCSLILLVAMIGCIVLTLHHKAHVKRQEIFKQVSRNVQTAISLKQ